MNKLDPEYRFYRNTSISEGVRYYGTWLRRYDEVKWDILWQEPKSFWINNFSNTHPRSTYNYLEEMDRLSILILLGSTAYEECVISYDDFEPRREFVEQLIKKIEN